MLVPQHHAPGTIPIQQHTGQSKTKGGAARSKHQEPRKKKCQETAPVKPQLQLAGKSLTPPVPCQISPPSPPPGRPTQKLRIQHITATPELLEKKGAAVRPSSCGVPPIPPIPPSLPLAGIKWTDRASSAAFSTKLNPGWNAPWRRSTVPESLEAGRSLSWNSTYQRPCLGAPRIHTGGHHRTLARWSRHVASRLTWLGAEWG